MYRARKQPSTAWVKVIAIGNRERERDEKRCVDFSVCLSFTIHLDIYPLRQITLFQKIILDKKKKKKKKKKSFIKK